MQQRMATFLCLPVFCLAMWALSPSAHAAEKVERGRCPTSAGTLHAAVYYTPNNGTYHVERISFNIQDNRAKHNNVYARLRDNGGKRTYWAYTSGDNVQGEKTQQIPVNETVARSVKPYMKFEVTTDKTGPDPSCPIHLFLK